MAPRKSDGEHSLTGRAYYPTFVLIVALSSLTGAAALALPQLKYASEYRPVLPVLEDHGLRQEHMEGLGSLLP